LFRPEIRCRRLVAVDETVVKRCGVNHYLWAALDVDSGEVIAIYASEERSLARALTSLRRVLEICDGKPIIVVDRGPWIPWALKRLGIRYFHETYGERNRMERWFRTLKERTKRFYNNVNSRRVEAIEGIAKAITLTHNHLIRRGIEGAYYLVDSTLL